ncbi:MAG: pirin family protein [Pseudomonadales bacterium]
MNAIDTTPGFPQGNTSDGMANVSDPISGSTLNVGMGFTAQSFSARDIKGLMDPLVMVDHYVMTQPTFGEHPHAGMSAVSLLLEDSEGLFHNRDSLGHDFDLRPGDLYWLSAGSGAVHDESPRANARTHGLQVFVNVPQTQRFAEPSSLLVRLEEMPVIKTEDYRVKVALGESNGVRGAASPSTPMTILVGTLQPGGEFSHGAVADRGIWTQSIEGGFEVVVADTASQLTDGQAVAAKTNGSASITIRNPSRTSVQFVLFDGAQINESYVQQGPFVMGSQEQIEVIKAAYAAGELGSIAGNH